MDRLAQVPWGPFGVSTVFALAALLAILGFGAHPLILVPIAIAATTLNIGLDNRAARRSGRL
jgi:hypothetical protein